MNEKIKSAVTENSNIEKYGFEWLPEPLKESENFIELAAYTLSHKLKIVLAYQTKEKKYYIFFGHHSLLFEAVLNDDFFSYLHTHYIQPAQKIGIHLSEEEYRKRRTEFRDAFVALKSDLEDSKKTKSFTIHLGEEDWNELMTFLENNMVMNPMLTPHASLMHMATIHASDYTISCTQASTTQFYIDAPYATGSSEFQLIFTYYPDTSKYNPVPAWCKIHKQLAAAPVPIPKGIPKDFPIDAFGALYYLFGTD